MDFVVETSWEQSVEKYYNKLLTNGFIVNRVHERRFIIKIKCVEELKKLSVILDEELIFDLRDGNRIEIYDTCRE